MDRRAFALRIATLGLAPTLWMSGCARAGTFSVGVHPWPGYECLYLAEFFGWLPPDIRLQKNASASASLAALRAGTIDSAALTLDEVLVMRGEGIPLTVVLALNESLGADVVMVRPHIDTLAALKGARMAVERSAVGAIVLSKALEAAGLTEADVKVVDLPHDAQLAAWYEGRVDAVVTFAPTDALIERAGGRRLFDSRHFPATIFDVLAVRRDRMRGRARSIRALVASHFRGLDHLRVNRDDALRRVAVWRGLTFDEMRRGFGGLVLPNLSENRRLLAPDGHLTAVATTLSQLMVARGLLAHHDSLHDLINGDYLPARGDHS